MPVYGLGSMYGAWISDLYLFMYKYTGRKNCAQLSGCIVFLNSYENLSDIQFKKLHFFAVKLHTDT